MGVCECGHRRFWQPPSFPPHYVILVPGEKRPAHRGWQSSRPSAALVRATLAAGGGVGLVPSSVRLGVIDVDAGRVETVLTACAAQGVTPCGVWETVTPGHWHVAVPAEPSGDFRFSFGDGTTGDWKSTGYVVMHAPAALEQARKKARGRRRLFDPGQLPRSSTGSRLPGRSSDAPVQGSSLREVAHGAVPGRRNIAHWEALAREANRVCHDGTVGSLAEAIEYGERLARAMWRSTADVTGYTVASVEASARSAFRHHWQRHEAGAGPYRGVARYTREACVRGGRVQGLAQRIKRIPRWREIMRWFEAHGRRVRETIRKFGIGAAQFYRAKAFHRAERDSAVPSPLVADVPPLKGGVNTPYSRACRRVIEAWRRLTRAPVPWFTGLLAPP